MTEFIDIHVRKIHGGHVESSSPTRPSEEQSGGDEATTSSSLRGCPECGEELRMAAIIKHCKVKHKVKNGSYKQWEKIEKITKPVLDFQLSVGVIT